ncbi:metallophosphoesterase [Neptunomonas antarctica]|uniref:Icc protein n=1 Tax=Neptunomonas antarctica TaxID=619304 RepID=A0A1N7J7G4_9GAMM|nr:metallophosphoesterase [Neptunomonas antarctica]SIS45191.1 Icc protein [Neptunomonas antarctica]
MNKIRIIQVTDCHLQASADHDFKGENPEQRLLATLTHIRKDHPFPDVLLLTGDLAHHGYESAYKRLQTYTQGMAKKVRWIPGNHDVAATMQEYTELSGKVICQGSWCIILLDSTAEADGKGKGSLSADELSWLNKVAAEHVGKYLLLVLHHPPLAVGSLWQDQIMLGNAQSFLSQVGGYETLKLLLCGHLHQDHQLQHNDVTVLATPATAPQFAVGTAAPELESDPYLSLPGYRVIDLFDDGRFSTEVKRVTF